MHVEIWDYEESPVPGNPARVTFTVVLYPSWFRRIFLGRKPSSARMQSNSRDYEPPVEYHNAPQIHVDAKIRACVQLTLTQRREKLKAAERAKLEAQQWKEVGEPPKTHQG